MGWGPEQQRMFDEAKEYYTDTSIPVIERLERLAKDFDPSPSTTFIRIVLLPALRGEREITKWELSRYHKKWRNSRSVGTSFWMLEREVYDLLAGKVGVGS